eukprot:193049-Prorocentrum_minimum.AAC.7
MGAGVERQAGGGPGLRRAGRAALTKLWVCRSTSFDPVSSTARMKARLAFAGFVDFFRTYLLRTHARTYATRRA